MYQDFDNMTDEELAACEAKLKQMEQAIPEPGEDPERYRRAMSSYNSVKNRNASILRRHKTQYDMPEVPMRTHAVSLGDICFATNNYSANGTY